MKTAELELVPRTGRLRPFAHPIAAARPATIEMVSRLTGLDRILVPIDFSEASESAVPYAITFAQQYGAKITLLHVVDLWPDQAIKPGDDYHAQRTAMGVEAISRLKLLALTKVPAALDTQTEVRFGTAWFVIAEAAREWQTDLLILTTRGLTGLQHILLGSTAERVLRHAPCPVLVVREPTRGFVAAARGGRCAAFHEPPKQRHPAINPTMNTTTDPLPAAASTVATPEIDRVSTTGDTMDLVPEILHLKSILVPIDFSETSLKALQYAVPFAQQFGATLTLLHVVPPPPLIAEGGYVPLAGEETLQAAEEHLHKIAESLVGPGFTLRAITRGGFVHDTILGVARDSAVDLIILTTHGYTGLKHLLMGSTAESIVRHAPCPVLVVREKEHEFV